MTDPVDVRSIELRRFRSRENGVTAYQEGLKLLVQSGLLGLLRRFSRPFTFDRGANPYSSAYAAGVSEGYNKCLDDIEYFDEQYLQGGLPSKQVRPTFGAEAIALAKGDLTQKDLEKLHGRK